MTTRSDRGDLEGILRDAEGSTAFTIARVIWYFHTLARILLSQDQRVTGLEEEIASLKAWARVWGKNWEAHLEQQEGMDTRLGIVNEQGVKRCECGLKGGKEETYPLSYKFCPRCGREI